MRPTPLPLIALATAICAGCDDPRATAEAPPADGAVDAGGARDAEPVAEPDAEPDAAPAPAFCEGTTAQRYDPFGAPELELFPDDLLTGPDPASPTGLRLDLSRSGWLGRMPRLMQQTLADTDTLSGFAHNGAIVVRFTGPIAPWTGTIETSTADPAVMLFDLDAAPPRRVPFSVTASEGGAAMLIQPERPLRAGARHGLLVRATDPDGGCVAPSPTLRALLEADPALDGRLAALAPTYRALLDAAGMPLDAVSAATVFTTHADTHILREIAETLGEHPAEWAVAPLCSRGRWGRECTGFAQLTDYRDDRAVLTAEPGATWIVRVELELPAADGPAPVLLMGHGIGSDRGEAGRVAEHWTPEGAAVVALDALRHGEHPTADPDEPFETRIASFLGLDLATLTIDGRQLTGNFDQTTLDRLQLLDLLRRQPDLDGDGVDDLDPARVGYYGISLGGLLGPALVALDPGIELAVLQVPGGRLARFATSSEPVERFMPIVINLFGSRDRFERLLPLLQTAVDRADPATWAPLMMDRAGGPPHTLMQVSTFDEIVPPDTGAALARALDLPHAGEIVAPVALLTAQPTPTSGNLPGAASGGFTQFDRVGPDDRPRASGHHSTPHSDQALHQLRAFVLPWLAGEQPQIVDAYAERGTAPLP